MPNVKLLIQPDDGVESVVGALNKAKTSIEIAIFRCDHKEIEKALVNAVRRGVAVQALIASTNHGGESSLRGLESRLLAAGAVVSRTNNDLPRYHGKYLIIDGRKLYVLGFNFTRADLKSTRSFGIVTTKEKAVQEASKLFTSDATRQDYSKGSNALLVSPINSRDRLANFLSGAKRELLIFDLEVSDTAMVSVLKARAEAGVSIRIIGKLKEHGEYAEVRNSHPLRLHARTIVRDREAFFLGSQSLRRLELDMRREVGIIVDDAALAARIAKVFEDDWTSAVAVDAPVGKVAKRVAKAVAKQIKPVAAIVDQVVAKTGEKLQVDCPEIDQLVKEAVKVAVRDVVQEAVLAGAGK
jgi:phosphatidylserine/phosphatidylglycerophosphate/cardiolipin synthase-like enzyme